VSPLLQTFLLAAAGALFALLFILNVLLKTIARSQKVGFLDLLLTFQFTVLLLLALVFTSLDAKDVLPMVIRAVLGVAAVVAVFSLLMLIAESRRDQGLKGSRGLLGIWAAVLLVISTFTVPILAERMNYVPPAPTFVAADGSVVRAASTDDPNSTEEATATPPPTSTPTVTFTPTATRTPRPTLPPTATIERFVFSTRTPEPTPTLVTPCVALVRNNLRLRAAPNRDAETLATIPFDTSVSVYGRTEDSTWWYVLYEDQRGWVDGEFIQTTSGCASLPVQDAD
jgi:hypothetical protein